MFGSQFRITLDDAAHCEPSGKNDPWYFQIPCKYGNIYPYSDRLLGFHCEGERVRARLHRDHPEIEAHQWSDDGEAIFLFKPDQFELIAQYAQPSRKKRLSNDHLRKLIAAGRDHQF